MQAPNQTTRRVLQAGAIALLLTHQLGHAAFFRWEAVTAPANAGASCGNGTPYRFFVNRTPLTSRTIVIFEGGGACFGQQTCRGDLINRGAPQNGVMSAANPEGIPLNYMTSLVSTTPSGGVTVNQSALGMVTPFTDRLGLLSKVQTQAWNIVFLPYCTGDIHIGNMVSVYADHDPSNPKVQHHRGYVNEKFAANWMATNMSRPDKLFVTGFSAGGYGAAANYDTLRRTLNPRSAAMLDDGGPIFTTPEGGTASSLPLYTRIRQSWGTDGSQGLITELMTRYPGSGGDPRNLASLIRVVATVYPKDRLGFATMLNDQVIPRFAYEPFYPEILATPVGASRDKLMNDRWRQEIGDTLGYIQDIGNVGYYIPHSRDLLMSHTLTLGTFSGTGVPEANISSVTTFIDNLLDESGTPVIRVQATQASPGHDSPWSQFIRSMASQFLALMGA